MAAPSGFRHLAVDGDATFGADSVVNIATPDDITTLVFEVPISVVSETGAFANDGVTVNVLDDDFLIDYDVVIGSVSVTPTAADLAVVSTDTNISEFGGAVTNALAGGALPSDVAQFLNASTDTASFEGYALSLLPAVNNGVTREIYETQDLANALIENRLRGEGDGIWGQFLYRNANRNADSTSVSGYDADAFGFAIGYDRQLSEALRAGLTFNYANIDIDADTGQQTDIDALQISVYAGYERGALFANGIVGYSFNNVDAQRSTQVGLNTSDSEVNGVNVQGTLGIDLVSGTSRVGPVVGIQYANLSQESYVENGGLGLSVDPEGVSFLDLSTGFEASTTIENGDWSVRPLARAAYVYDAVGDARVFNTSFVGGSPFEIRTTEPAQSRFEVGAGLELSNKSGVALSLEYDGEFASGYSSNGGFLRARFDF